MIQENYIYHGRPWRQHYSPSTNKELLPFEFKNLPEMIFKAYQKYSSQTAYKLVLPNGLSGSLTYKESHEYSDDFAVYLKEVLKLKDGERIAIQLPNCLAYPVCVFGALKAGCIVVNTNPLYTSYEMEHQFIDSEASVLIIIDMFANKLTEILKKTKIKKVILVSLVDFFSPHKKLFIHSVLKYIKKTIPKCEIQSEKLNSVLQIGRQIKNEKAIDASLYWKNISEEHTCALQYTGGTTGVSKGAVLSHKNILANMYQIIEMGKDKMEDGKECILTVLPLYHIFAFTLNLITFYYYGGLNILIPNPRPLTNLKKAFQQYNITWISGVNTLFNGLLNESWFTKNCVCFLKASIAGGTALHKSVAEKWLAITGTLVVEGFGLSETSPVVTFNPISGQIKADTVGIPVPSTDVAIINDDGEPVALGEIGEIVVKGPQVMSSYWNKPQETEKSLHNNWFFTGDVAFMDKDGYIKIVDRKKDMIIVSGFNVYPNEIEDIISQHSDVLEVAVIGVPSELTGECVKAFIVLKNKKLTSAEIEQFCRKYLTSYKIPKIIEFINALPKTPVGKILRKNLRENKLKN